MLKQYCIEAHMSKEVEHNVGSQHKVGLPLRPRLSCPIMFVRAISAMNEISCTVETHIGTVRGHQGLSPRIAQYYIRFSRF